jgi:hypothetical protein
MTFYGHFMRFNTKDRVAMMCSKVWRDQSETDDTQKIESHFLQHEWKFKGK